LAGTRDAKWCLLVLDEEAFVKWIVGVKFLWELVLVFHFVKSPDDTVATSSTLTNHSPVFWLE